MQRNLENAITPKCGTIGHNISVGEDKYLRQNGKMCHFHRQQATLRLGVVLYMRLTNLCWGKKSVFGFHTRTGQHSHFLDQNPNDKMTLAFLKTRARMLHNKMMVTTTDRS